MQHLKITHIGILLSALTLGACSNDDDNKKPLPVVNTAPSVSDIMLTTQTEVNITDSLTAIDKEGDSLTYSLVSEPSLGMVNIDADGNFTYTPKPVPVEKEAATPDSNPSLPVPLPSMSSNDEKTLVSAGR